MNAQRAMAREALKNRESSWANHEISVPAECPKTKFRGYETLLCEGEILYLIRPDGSCVQEADEGEEVILVTDETPFYAESGGQAGDKGVIDTEGGTFRVTSVTKTSDEKWRHLGTVIHGAVSVGAKAVLMVDRQERLCAERNHE